MQAPSSVDPLTGIVLGIGSLGAGLAAWFGPGPGASLAIAAALALVGSRIVWQDLADYTIPDAATLALGLLGLASRLCDGIVLGEPPGATLLLVGLDAAICGGALLALREIYYRRRGQDGIGFGDVKLAAAGGVLVGTTGFAWSVLGASLTGLAFVLALRLRPALSATGAPDRVAFGAILAPALWLTWSLAHFPTATGPL